VKEQSVERLPIGQHEMWLTQLRAPSRPRGVHCVDGLLPPGFETTLRLFHPFVPWKTPIGSQVPAVDRHRWSELADAAGVTFHAELTWRSLSPVLPINDDGRPYAVWEGDLEPRTRAAALAALAPEPSTPVFFYFGLGAIVRSGHPALFRAPAAVAANVCETYAHEVGQHVPGPEYTWPQDRAWVVCTDYDLTSTYIAADRTAAERLQANEDLELLPVTPDTRVDNGADQR
jgi:hypothetical protein